MKDKKMDASGEKVLSTDESTQSGTVALNPGPVLVESGKSRSGLVNLLRSGGRDFPGYNPDRDSSLSSSASNSDSESSEEEVGFRKEHFRRDSPYIEIHGEPFQVQSEDGQVTLTHDHWSLMGSGDTLLEAQEDLYECARRLAPAYVHRTADQMTKEAARMRAYIAYIMSYAVR